MEIQSKEITESPIDNNEAIGDGNSPVVEVPQELLEYFNIKPEDSLSSEDTQRIQEIYRSSKEIFPTGSLGEIMRFIGAVERANPAYGASETDRLFNLYKNFKLGRIYGH